MSFKIKSLGKPKLKNPILIEGLPGMGNVGKIAVDFMIEHMQAKKFLEISSHNFPNSVFVNEENLIELPKIGMYYKNTKDRSIMFLAGDVQPTDEKSCYAFCEEVLNVIEKYHAKDWKIVYCKSARVLTVVPDTFKRMIKQQIRWKKSFIRNIFFTGAFYWKRPLLPALFYYLHIFFVLVVLRLLTPLP